MIRTLDGNVTRRAGVGLAEVLPVIILALLLAALVFFLIGRGAGLDTSVDVQSITLSPSISTVAYGSSGTFTLTIQFENPYDRTKDSAFKAYIYEDDTVGDVVLDSTVVVLVPRGGKTGSVAFTLDCSGTGAIQGPDGSRFQRFADYDVYAVLQPIPNGVQSAASEDVEVECRQGDEGQ